MTHELDKEEYEEKAALYALGALSQHEARSFERHLAEGCSSCKVAMLQFEQVVGTIALESPAATPSVYLRDMLMARIEREGQGDTIPAGQAQTRDSRHLPGSRQERTTSSQKSTRSPSSFGRVIIPWAVAAALAVAMLGSLYALNRAGTESDTLRARLAAVESQTRTLEINLLRQETRTVELIQVNDVLTSDEHRVIALAGQAPAPSASAKIYWDIRNNKWVVTANLPPAPQGKVYQLWFVTAAKPVSAGLIASDEKGHGFTVANVPSNIGPIAFGAITLEPEGGSNEPTLPIYAIGKAG